ILLVSASLTGCMGSGQNLPEGDFKIVTQPSTGVIEILLQSADYGASQSTVASIVLPKDSKYEIVLSMERYVDGKLEDKEVITKYTTDVIQDKVAINFVGNAGKVSDKYSNKTIYLFSELDNEKTKDKKNPKYKFEKYYENSMDFDKKVEIGPLGTDLNKEIPMIGYLKFKDDDKEKKDIDLSNYKKEVGNYKSANIITIKAIKK
ncbi:MAG: hypothetical protein ACRC1Y_04425, partial [Paraclostridium sp.]